jgi:predicted small integral membrane protein
MSWMAWTQNTAIFFCCIALILVVMTLWELQSPSLERKGFLPMETTRGDRVFIGLLSSAYIHLAFLAATQLSLWIVLGISVVWSLALLRWG